MPSPAFESFIAPAARRPALWRLGLGLLLGAAIFAAWNAALLALVTQSGWANGGTEALTALARSDTPGAVLLLFASFGGMVLAAAAAALLHRRGPRSLIGPDPRRALRDFAAAALIVAAIYAPALLGWTLAFDSRPGLAPALWAALLPLTLLGLLLQTGAEELLFRGYLTQQLAARFRSPLLWFVLPALVFGLFHFDPATGGPNAWLMVLAATAFGLIATDLTRRTGSLGAAWGFHFANNFAAIALLATDDTITGAALRITPYSADDPRLILPLTLGDLALMALAWLVLSRRLGRRAAAA
jgi:hypothetical protein